MGAFLKRILGVLQSPWRFSRVLGDGLPEFLAVAWRDNARIARLGFLFMALWNLASLALFLPQFLQSSKSSPFVSTLAFLYFSDIVLGTLFFLASRWWLATGRGATSLKEIVIFVVFLTWVSAVVLAFDANHHRVSPQITNIQFLLLMVSVLFVFLPWAALGYFVSFGTAVLVVVSLVSPDAFQRGLTIQNAIYAWLAAVVINRVLFANRVSGFIKLKTIERQSEEIEAEKLKNRILRFSFRHGLSPRERELIPGILQGASNRALAESQFVSVDTVKKHLYHIFQKTHAKSRLHLIRLVEAGEDGSNSLLPGAGAKIESDESVVGRGS